MNKLGTVRNFAWESCDATAAMVAADTTFGAFS